MDPHDVFVEFWELCHACEGKLRTYPGGSRCPCCGFEIDDPEVYSEGGDSVYGVSSNRTSNCSL